MLEMSNKLILYLVVPCYNEEEILKETIKGICAYRRKRQSGILYT